MRLKTAGIKQKTALNAVFLCFNQGFSLGFAVYVQKFAVRAEKCGVVHKSEFFGGFALFHAVHYKCMRKQYLFGAHILHHGYVHVFFEFVAYVRF